MPEPNGEDKEERLRMQDRALFDSDIQDEQRTEQRTRKKENEGERERER